MALEKSVAAYAKDRGFRPGKVSAKLEGLTPSGKSTRARVDIGGRSVEVAVNRRTGRVQPASAAALTTALVAAHQPEARAGLGARSRYANKVLAFRPGSGALLGDATAARAQAPLGRPRAGQSTAALALDAVSLGKGGSIALRLNTPIIAGRPNAALRVRENGLGSGDIINQTPGLVEVSGGGRWYRLGYAGYKTAGDVLPLSKALDTIPSGMVMTSARITDAPGAPHPRGMDPTDNATARARGVGGFDLVSVESMPDLSAKVRANAIK